MPPKNARIAAIVLSLISLLGTNADPFSFLPLRTFPPAAGRLFPEYSAGQDGEVVGVGFLLPELLQFIQ